MTEMALIQPLAILTRLLEGGAKEVRAGRCLGGAWHGAGALGWELAAHCRGAATAGRSGGSWERAARSRRGSRQTGAESTPHAWPQPKGAKWRPLAKARRLAGIVEI